MFVQPHIPITFCGLPFLGFRRLAGSTSLDPSVVDKISLSEMYIDDPDRDYYTLVPLGSFRLEHDVLVLWGKFRDYGIYLIKVC
jgi:hypothetical protein